MSVTYKLITIAAALALILCAIAAWSYGLAAVRLVSSSLEAISFIIVAFLVGCIAFLGAFVVGVMGWRGEL